MFKLKHLLPFLVLFALVALLTPVLTLPCFALCVLGFILLTQKEGRHRHWWPSARTMAIWLPLLFLVALPMLAFAQTTTSGAPTANATASPLSPWVGLIPVAVPVLIMLLKTFIPNIPGVALPIIAPLIGAAGDIVMHYAGLSTLGPTWGAVLGSAGVGLREIYDQVHQSVSTPAPTPGK